MNITAEDVVNIRKKLNLNQKQFAELLIVSRQTLRNWELNKNPVPATKFDFFKNLMDGKINTNADLQDSENFNIVQLPVITAKAYASFSGHHDADSFNYVDEPVIEYMSEKIPDKKQVIIEVVGDSMLPTLHSAAKVLAYEVNPADYIYTPPGIYGVAYRNEFVVKRIKKNTLLEEKKIELFSDNERYGSMIVYAGDIRLMYRLTKIIDQKIE